MIAPRAMHCDWLVKCHCVECCPLQKGYYRLKPNSILGNPTLFVYPGTWPHFPLYVMVDIVYVSPPLLNPAV